MIHKIFKSEYTTIGIGTTPFNAWLILRGLRALPIRLERFEKTTLEVIDFLQNHLRWKKFFIH